MFQIWNFPGEHALRPPYCIACCAFGTLDSNPSSQNPGSAPDDGNFPHTTVQLWSIGIKLEICGSGTDLQQKQIWQQTEAIEVDESG